MRNTLFAAVLAAGSVGLASGALADGWNIRDLGAVNTRDQCNAMAVDVLDWYQATYFGNSNSASSWTTYTYNVTPGDNDVVIMCPFVNGVINAFLIVFTDGETTADEGSIVADRIQFRWDDMGSSPVSK